MPSGEDGWQRLRDSWQQLNGLVGTDMPSIGRWSDMARHLHFAEPHDLADIASRDWPSVRQSILDELFLDDPLPVDVNDLSELTTTDPTGPVSTQLNWDVLDPDGFERVVLEIVASLDNYEMRLG